MAYAQSPVMTPTLVAPARSAKRLGLKSRPPLARHPGQVSTMVAVVDLPLYVMMIGTKQSLEFISAAFKATVQPELLR